jgi:hypothetical protein
LNLDKTLPTRVLTLTPGLPLRVLDQILTATEQSLTEAGATRVWALRSTSGTVVMADLPADSGHHGEHTSPRVGVENAALEPKTLRHRAHLLRSRRAARGTRSRLESPRRSAELGVLDSRP